MLFRSSSFNLTKKVTLVFVAPASPFHLFCMVLRQETTLGNALFVVLFFYFYFYFAIR